MLNPNRLLRPPPASSASRCAYSFWRRSASPTYSIEPDSCWCKSACKVPSWRRRDAKMTSKNRILPPRVPGNRLAERSSGDEGGTLVGELEEVGEHARVRRVAIG